MTPFDILLTGLAVASISMTVALSNALAGVRETVSKLGRWPRELIHCPYCLSHWLSLGFVSQQMGLWPLSRFILTTLGVVTIASLASLGIGHLFLILDDDSSEENE